MSLIVVEFSWSVRVTMEMSMQMIKTSELPYNMF